MHEEPQPHETMVEVLVEALPASSASTHDDRRVRDPVPEEPNLNENWTSEDESGVNNDLQTSLPPLHARDDMKNEICTVHEAVQR